MAQVKMGDSTGDQWNEMAKIYQRLTFQTSYGPIGKMLERANALLPFYEATAILDNGCGPGPIMSRILKDYNIPDSCSLTCADFSEGMIGRVREQREEKLKEDSNSAWKRLETMVQDATDLKDIESASKSHITAGWVYFMTSDPMKCLSESKRVLKDGGVLTCSSWKGSQWLDMMTLLTQVRPDKAMPEIPDGWKEADALKTEMDKAGFREVETFEVRTKMEFERMEAFVDFMLYKMPHMQMLAKDMTEEELGKVKALMMEKGREMCASEPGELTGTALVAVGRK